MGPKMWEHGPGVGQGRGGRWLHRGLSCPSASWTKRVNAQSSYTAGWASGKARKVTQEGVGITEHPGPTVQGGQHLKMSQAGGMWPRSDSTTYQCLCSHKLPVVA